MKAIRYIVLDVIATAGRNGSCDVTIEQDGDEWAVMHLGQDETVASCIREVIKTTLLFESFF